MGLRQGRKQERLEWENRRIEEIVKVRLRQSRAVLGGLVSEQMAPLLPGFPYDPGDCRFVGKPIDFIVFKGMNEKNINEVIFLEVKSGASPALNDQEKKLRDAIRAGRVSWVEYHLHG
jgi:predicted Holliday junction resolvase-like endonuclease